MKKAAALLIMLALILCSCAFALTSSDYPAWDGTSTPDNSLCGSIDGQNTVLAFDSSANYSGISENGIEACFFAFDAAEQNYLEIYLLIPPDAASGSVYSSQSQAMSAVSLYEVYPDESYAVYYAAQIMGMAYPNGSGYELRIDTVEKTADGMHISGSLNGVICEFKGDLPTDKTLELKGLRFDFTLPSTKERAPQPEVSPKASAAPSPTPQASNAPRFPIPEATAAPKKPQPTLDPHPAFTLPPDYAIL